MLTRKEVRLALEIGAIVVYLLALYLASSTLQETISVFDYGRF
jgi:hypothetical protein